MIIAPRTLCSASRFCGGTTSRDANRSITALASQTWLHHRETEAQGMPEHALGLCVSVVQIKVRNARSRPRAEAAPETSRKPNCGRLRRFCTGSERVLPQNNTRPEPGQARD